MFTSLRGHARPLLSAVLSVVLAVGMGLAHAAVDLNRASQAELETVKGIGPGLSGKILAERKKGDFKTWDDFISRVGGVGPGNAAKFSGAGLTIQGAGYAGDSGAAVADKSSNKKPSATDKAK